MAEGPQALKRTPFRRLQLREGVFSFGVARWVIYTFAIFIIRPSPQKSSGARKVYRPERPALCSRALLFTIKTNFARPAWASPARQWLPLWGQRRRPPPAAETGRSCWGSGQQDASDSEADAGSRNPALASGARLRGLLCHSDPFSNASPTAFCKASMEMVQRAARSGSEPSAGMDAASASVLPLR